MKKYFKLSTTVIFAIIIITAISEFLILNTNFKLKKKISAYKRLEELLLQAQQQLSKFNYERSLEGKCLPFFIQEQLFRRKNNKYMIQKSRFIILFFFDITGCSSCIKSDISTLNEFATLYPDKICQVIGVTEPINSINYKLLIHSMKIKFLVVQINSMKSKLADYGIKSTPVVLFGDIKINKSIYVFFPPPFEKSIEGFTQKLQSFLANCDL